MMRGGMKDNQGQLSGRKRKLGKERGEKRVQPIPKVQARTASQSSYHVEVSAPTYNAT